MSDKKNSEKPFLILEKRLPDGITFKPPNKGQKPKITNLPKFYDKKMDKTLTKRERGLIVFCILIFSLFAVFILFIMFSRHEHKRRMYQNPPKTEVITQTKSFVISLEQIENTSSENLYKTKNASQVKVGDEVSYKNGSGNTDPSSLHSIKRNLSGPLYSSNDGFGYGTNSSIRAPKLPIGKNSYIRAYLENNITSDNVDAPITAISYTELFQNGKSIIPKGSKFIMKATKLTEDNRIQMSCEYVIFPDGKEYSVRALAVGEDNVAGISGDPNYKLAKKGTSVVASSLLDAASTTMTVAGNSFGSVFAGKLAGNTSDSVDNAISYGSRNNGLSVAIPMNTRFKLVFE